MRELSGERVAFALRHLAEDLAIERRRVLRLERENRDLRAQLELLRRSPEEQSRRAAAPDSSDAAVRHIPMSSDQDFTFTWVNGHPPPCVNGPPA